MSRIDPNADLHQSDRFADQQGFQAVFNSNYPMAYRAFTQKLLDVVEAMSEPVAIVDLGCGDGWTAELIASVRRGRYVGIDLSSVSLAKLQERLAGHPNIAANGINQSGEWLLRAETRSDLQNLFGRSPNLFICNATLHQIGKAFPDVAAVLGAAVDLLDRDGRVIVGDYYYPPSLSDAEVEAARDWVRGRTGQNPTARAAFISPQSVRACLEAARVALTAFEQVLANPHIQLHYYVFAGGVRR